MNPSIGMKLKYIGKPGIGILLKDEPSIFLGNSIVMSIEHINKKLIQSGKSYKLVFDSMFLSITGVTHLIKCKEEMFPYLEEVFEKD